MRGRTGLEIGGPSAVFADGGLLPVYPLVGGLDNCNFARRTVWEERIAEGFTFRFDPRRPPGRQYIAEATDLSAVAGGTYELVLSSHTLEHTANPLKALREWIRVLRDDGIIVLVVPHREGTFDHRRPVTPLRHLVEDEKRGTGEDDLTHVPEILELHDLSRDPGADPATFTQRCRDNRSNRCLHHHVFDTHLAVDVVDHVGAQVLGVEALWPFHIIVVARTLPPGAVPQNARFRDPWAPHYRRSPFRTDRPVAPSPW